MFDEYQNIIQKIMHKKYKNKCRKYHVNPHKKSVNRIYHLNRKFKRK